MQCLSYYQSFTNNHHPEKENLTLRIPIENAKADT